MKRGLVFSLCALAAVAGSSLSQAQSTVDLSLNLRYTHPAVPGLGGTWYLMAKTNDDIGLAGVSAYIKNIDTTGMVLGNATVNAQYPLVGPTVTGSIVNGANPYNQTIIDVEDGPVVNVVWGFDNSGTGSVIAGIGKGTGTPDTTGNIASDPLKNPAWNGAALLASGTFGASRPVFVDNVHHIDANPAGNSTGANTLSSATTGANAELAVVTKTVRGDSLNTLNLESPGGTEGLRFGDRNRDFAVSLPLDIFPSLAAIGAGSGKTWEDGDFDGNGTVSLPTDIFPALGSIGLPGLPPAAGVVPEPSAFLMMGACLGSAVLWVGYRRRK